MTEQHEHLTQKQYDELKAELAELEGPRRTEVVQAIKVAREFGDLSENFEYHAAKNEQGLLEARIRTLRHRLETAEIVEVTDSAVVSVGTVVEIQDGGGKTMTIVRGLPPGQLDEIARDLKRLCATGGSVKDGAVEIQGDQRERVAERLRDRGFTVKLAGG